MKKKTFTCRFQPAPGDRKKKIPKNYPLQKYPLLPIRFYYKNKKTPIIEAMLDSGADKTMLNRSLAEYLNLPYKKKIESEGMGGKFKVFETEVGLIIGRGGNESDLGIIEAVFPEIEEYKPILIGRHPVFEEFQIIFEEFNDKFKLIPKEEILKKEKMSIY